jgi:hypothetical protein
MVAGAAVGHGVEQPDGGADQRRSNRREENLLYRLSMPRDSISRKVIYPFKTLNEKSIRAVWPGGRDGP